MCAPKHRASLGTDACPHCTELQRLKAQAIVNKALSEVREFGFGVVANGTVYGGGILFDSLEVRVGEHPELKRRAEKWERYKKDKSNG